MGGEVAGFAAELRRHRVAAGLTQEALAERAGLVALGSFDNIRSAGAGSGRALEYSAGAGLEFFDPPKD